MTGFDEIRRRPTLPGFIPVPSALAGLTALFGMGRGGPRRNNHLKALPLSRSNIVDMVKEQRADCSRTHPDIGAKFRAISTARL